MKKRLLVTGSGGFLGWHICRQAAGAWTVFGTFNMKRTEMADVYQVRTDLTDYGELRRLFRVIRPHAVIHAAAIPDPGYCQQHPSETRKINVDAASDIAGLCSAHEIPCIFTSTDLVFDGQNAPYSEESLVGPVCVYGEQKAEAERKMLGCYPETAVCRMPLMFGYSGGTRQCFDQQVMRSLLEGKSVRLFTDEFRTPVDAESGARGLLWTIGRIRGVIHLGGRTRISRYEMGIKLAELLGADAGLIKPVRQADLAMTAPRPADVSLDSTKAFSMGYAPLSIGTACRNMLEHIKIIR